MTGIRPDLNRISSIESKSGNMVSHVEDYARRIVFTNITCMSPK